MSKEEYTGKVYNRNAPNKKRKLKCDEWCEEYDKQPTKKLCRMLREECELTCVDGEKVRMTHVKVYVVVFLCVCVGS